MIGQAMIVALYPDCPRLGEAARDVEKHCILRRRSWSATLVWVATFGDCLEELWLECACVVVAAESRVSCVGGGRRNSCEASTGVRMGMGMGIKL
jgi:hypothetical protein